MPIATSDKHAFKLVKLRLEHDVGPLIPRMRHHGMYWALARMLLPVAEALGDLLHPSNGKNKLELVLEKDLEHLRPGYSDKSALITLMFRHSLAHQDELRHVIGHRITVKWMLAIDDSDKYNTAHLQVSAEEEDGDRVLRLTFELHAFYRDLVELCDRCIRGQHQGESSGAACAKYNEWLEEDLDNEPDKLRSTRKRARKEIPSLYTKALSQARK